MPITPDVIIGGAATVMVGVTAFFLRKIDSKIDHTAAQASALSEKILTIRDDLKEDMVEIFNYTCHERQGSCARLQEVKLNAIEHQAKTVCAKLATLGVERERRWDKQEALNEKFKSHIYKTKDGGAAWNNREEENGGSK